MMVMTRRMHGWCHVYEIPNVHSYYVCYKTVKRHALCCVVEAVFIGLLQGTLQVEIFQLIYVL